MQVLGILGDFRASNPWPALCADGRSDLVSATPPKMAVVEGLVKILMRYVRFRHRARPIAREPRRHDSLRPWRRGSFNDVPIAGSRRYRRRGPKYRRLPSAENVARCSTPTVLTASPRFPRLGPEPGEPPGLGDVDVLLPLRRLVPAPRRPVGAEDDLEAAIVARAHVRHDVLELSAELLHDVALGRRCRPAPCGSCRCPSRRCRRCSSRRGRCRPRSTSDGLRSPTGRVGALRCALQHHGRAPPTRRALVAKDKCLRRRRARGSYRYRLAPKRRTTNGRRASGQKVPRHSN